MRKILVGCWIPVAWCIAWLSVNAQPVAALACIAGGLAFVYWPAALVAVGLLLWFDIDHKEA